MISELNLTTLKNNHQLREYEEKKAQERKRNLLCLIAQYLRDEGYCSIAASLQGEVQYVKEYEICDNVDLSTILQDFETYYFVRFQKYPKICKKTNIEELNSNLTKKPSKGRAKKPDVIQTKSQNAAKLNEIGFTEKPTPDFGSIRVVPLGKDTSQEVKDERGDKILKPISGFGNQNPEWIIMAEIITKDIVLKDLNVHWADIMGLDGAKRLLKEAVVYPIKYPELFSGILKPWKGLLLFGPSGTGKTMLAKAVATECKTTFFNISSSTIISKWRGDSEKLVRVMFDLARYYAPSTIFIDEIDAIASSRDGSSSIHEHEASRRLKTELLVQLDGLSQSSDQVFLLATSNLPWELDQAMLRRLEKKILVDLPNLQARESMFQHYLPEAVLKQPCLRSNVDYSLLAKNTEEYSGSDIRLICKETAMQSIRKVFELLDRSNDSSKLSKLELKPIETKDVLIALERTNPSTTANLHKYKEWYSQYGSF